MTPREHFKVAFLARCAFDGVPMSQIPERIKAAHDQFGRLVVKTAFLGTVLGKGYDAAKSLASTLTFTGLPVAAAVPPLVGALGGYAAARATDIHDTDVKEMKDREVIDTYQRESHRLRSQKRLRDYLHSLRSSGGGRPY